MKNSNQAANNPFVLSANTEFEHRFDVAEQVLGKAGADALRRLYDFYGTSWLDWIASLYDTERGAFYYSCSARDNDGFLPDVESTCQAISTMSFCGAFKGYGGNLIEAFPKETQERCLKFVTSLQSPVDGYFYHPQWGTDIGSSRRGRDLSQALQLLNRFGGKPPYPTALERLSNLKENEPSVMPEYLLSKQAMLTYLDGLDVNNKSYVAGHTISSQNSQIIAAGLAELVCDYLNERQYPETGLWEKEANYVTMSGVVKIGSALGGLGSYVHNGDKIVDSAMDVILSDVDPSVVVYVFNPWGAFGSAIIGAQKAEQEAKEKGKTVDYSMAEIRERIYARLPELIDKTIEKLAKFRKPDGSFSYIQRCSSPYSQGVPVSIPETNEGDVNGLACALNYPLGSIFSVLGIPPIPLCNHNDFLAFREKLVDAHRREKRN